MSVFERVGLPEGASAEEIAHVIADRTCSASGQRYCTGMHCERDCIAPLITAYGQRELEAGRVETWEKAVRATCVHNDYGECVRDTARICGYADCPLMRGE